MICEKCGTKVQEGNKFCSVCGARIEGAELKDGNELSDKVNEQEFEVKENPIDDVNTEQTEAIEEQQTSNNANEQETSFAANQQTENSSNEQEPAFTANQQEYNAVFNADDIEDSASSKPKKKVKKIVLIPLIALFTFAVFAVTAFASPLAPYIQNAFFETFLSSEDYLKHVLKNGIKDSSDDVASLYAAYKNVFKEEQSGSFTFNLSLEEELKEILYEYTGTDIDKFDSVEVNGKSTIKDGKMSFITDYKLNDIQIQSTEIILDEEAQYVTYPEINPKALMMDFSDSTNPMPVLNQVMEIIPDEKVAKDIYKKYLTKVIEQIEDVDKKDEKVKAGDVTQKLTRLDAHVDEDVAINVVVAVLEELKEDQEIKAFIENIQELDSVKEADIDLYEEIQDGIDEILDNIEDLEMESFDVSFWIDDKGDIVGAGIEIQGGEIWAISTTKGKNTGLCFEFDPPSGEGIAGVTFEGSGTKSGKLFSGEYTLNVMGIDIVNITLTDVDTKRIDEEGIFNGTVTMGVEEKAVSMLKMMSGADEKLIEMLSDLKLVIKGSSESKEAIVNDISLVLGKETLAKMSIESTLSYEAEEIKIPEDYVDYENYSELEQWYEESNNDAINENLEKAGLGTEAVEDDYDVDYDEDTDYYAEETAEATEAAIEDYYYGY